jgi:hypothetical protein
MSDHQAAEQPDAPAGEAAAPSTEPTSPESAEPTTPMSAETTTPASAETTTEVLPPAPAANPYGIGQAQPGIPSFPAQSAYPTTKPKRSKIQLLRPVIGIAIVAALAIGGKIVHDQSQAKRSSDGSITTKGDLDAFSIKTGDCFTNPGEATDFSKVTALPCTQPHTAQVYGSFTYPDATNTAPDDTTMESTVADQCKPFEASINTTFASTNNMYGAYIRPNDDAWSKGNYTILCVISSDTAVSGTALTS